MEPAFFQAQGRADLWSGLMTKVGFCPVPDELVIFDSVVADFVGEIRRCKSQQTLNCALSVDLL